MPKGHAKVPDPWAHIPLTDLSYQILLALAGEELHGYAILKAITNRTDGRLEPDTGTLYTALRRLRRDNLLRPVEGSGEGRRGRSYALTRVGRRVLALESERLADLVAEARARRVLTPQAGG